MHACMAMLSCIYNMHDVYMHQYIIVSHIYVIIDNIVSSIDLFDIQL